MDIFRPFLDIVRQCKNQMGVSECQKFHYIKMDIFRPFLDIVRQCWNQMGVSECQKFHYIKMDFQMNTINVSWRL